MNSKLVKMKYEQFYSKHIPNPAQINQDCVIWDDFLVDWNDSSIIFWRLDDQTLCFKQVVSIPAKHCVEVFVWKRGDTEVSNSIDLDEPSYLISHHQSRKYNLLRRWNKKGQMIEESNDFNPEQDFTLLYPVSDYLIFETGDDEVPLGEAFIGTGISDIVISGMGTSRMPSDNVLIVSSAAQLWDFVKSGFRIVDVDSGGTFSVNLESKLEKIKARHSSDVDEEESDEDSDSFSSDSENDLTKSLWSKNPCGCEWQDMVATGLWNNKIYFWKAADYGIDYVGCVQSKATSIMDMFEWRNYLCVEDSNNTIDFYCWDKLLVKCVYAYSLELDRTTNPCIVPVGDYLCDIQLEELTFYWRVYCAKYLLIDSWLTVASEKTASYRMEETHYARMRFSISAKRVVEADHGNSWISSKVHINIHQRKTQYYSSVLEKAENAIE